MNMYLDTRESSIDDDLNKSVDYGAVCHFAYDFMKEHTFKLIETAAERLAEDILIEFPLVDHIQLTLKKPWAPIGLPLEEVSVGIERGWHTVFLSMGANMGEKEENIKEAISLLDGNDKIRVIKESSFIVTKPYGNVDQDDFINCAIEIKTLLSPKELLMFCKNLEKMAGRVKKEHWGPRPLDIDIVFYDDNIIDLPELTIPHVDMCNREFVLDPLSEIAPYFRHPVNRKTVTELCNDLKKEKWF